MARDDKKRATALGNVSGPAFILGLLGIALSALVRIRSLGTASIALPGDCVKGGSLF